MADKFEFYTPDVTQDGPSYSHFHWGGQTFTPAISHRITSVKVKLLRWNSPGLITVGVHVTGPDGRPSGGPVVSGTTDGNSLPVAGGAVREVPLSGYLVGVAGETYAISIQPASPLDINSVYWASKYPAPGYAGGSALFSNDDGVTWGFRDADNWFEEWGVREYPEVPIGPGALLVEICIFLANLFYAVFGEVYGWVYPFNLAAPLFLAIADYFLNMAWTFVDVNTWMLAAGQLLANILSPDQLLALILGWWPRLQDVIDWFASWPAAVGSAISNWWAGMVSTVQGWISAATQGLTQLLVDWGQFVTVTLPALLNWDNLAAWWQGRLDDVQSLINSAFTTRESFWSGWQDVRENVLSFISRPWTWLEHKFADWFFGGE